MSGKKLALVLGLLGLSPLVASANDDKTPPVRRVSSASLGAPQSAESGDADKSASGECCNFVGFPVLPTNRFYGQVEYLIWWLQGVNTPVLATADDNLVGIPPGVLGGPETRIVLGGDRLRMGSRQGGRFTVGYWLDCEQTLGVEANYFFVGNRSTSAGVTAPGDPTLGTPTIFRPFFDGILGMENALFVAGPFTPGGITMTARQELYGAEVNLRAALGERGNLSVDLLAGFRFLALDEGLDIATSSGAAPAPIVSSIESFGTRNRFYGGQLGADVVFQASDYLFFKFRPKFALGANQQTITIAGNSVVADPTTGAIIASGPATLLAQSTNIGQHERSQLCFVPEIGVQMGYQLTNGIFFTVGYTWLYMTTVARPGDVIDRNTTVPAVGLPAASATNPAVIWHNAGFWAQGIDIGLTFRY